MDRAKRIIEETLSWVMGGLFIYAGIIKLLRPDLLLTDIDSYQLVGYRMAYLFSFYLPAVEIIAGLGLLHRWLRREAAWLVVVMMSVFIIAIITAWVRGLDISCGCFGATSDATNYPWLVIRDLLIASACFSVLYLQRYMNSNERSH